MRITLCDQNLLRIGYASVYQKMCKTLEIGNWTMRIDMDLARERTKAKWFLENPVTSETDIGSEAFVAISPRQWPRLWPLIQEYDFGTVIGIGLQ